MFETALYQAFGSPSKSVYPSLREPASSQTHLFSNTVSSSSKPTPFSRAANSFFNTPRKPDVDQASSGGETPKSPEHATDTDATPDNSLNFRAAAVKFSGSNNTDIPSFTAGDRPTSPAKREKRRDSWYHKFLPSPGRGEVARGAYTDKAVKRVSKRRKNKALARLRRDSISDSEASDMFVSPRKTSGGRGKGHDQGMGANDDGRKGSHWMTTFFDEIENRPRLPHVVSWWAQLAGNCLVFGFICYVGYSFWSAIKSDVDMHSEEAIATQMHNMALCAKDYAENKCGRETRMPALESACNNWEQCMNKDPKAVGRARVSARTFAEIINSFLEPISYKTMVSQPTTLPSSSILDPLIYHFTAGEESSN